MIDYRDMLTCVMRRLLGERNDCTVIACAVTCSVPYATAHDALENAGRLTGRGAPLAVQHRAFAALGFRIVPVNDARFENGWARLYHGKGRLSRSTTRTIGRRYPRGTFLAYTRRLGHVAALVDGEVHDWTAGRRCPVDVLGRVVPAEDACDESLL